MILWISYDFGKLYNLTMTRVKYNRNPKLDRDQLIVLNSHHQNQTHLLLNHLETLVMEMEELKERDKELNHQGKPIWRWEPEDGEREHGLKEDKHRH